MSTFTQLIESTNIEQCLLKRDHTLVKILAANLGFDCYSVVRWCTTCGAVVVDGEIDDRVAPGREMKMTLPVLAANVWRRLQEQEQEHTDHASP